MKEFVTMDIQQLVITGEREAALQTCSLEPTLSANDLFVQSEASFISAGTELSIYTGTEPATKIPGTWCYYPSKVGYSNVGKILAKGENVTGFEVGERVFTFAPHVSHYVYQLNSGNLYRSLVVKIPDSLPLEVASVLHMPHVAMTALNVASSVFGKRVVVVGLGVVGNLAAQMFQLAGAAVIGIDPAKARRDLAERCGISRTLASLEDLKQQADISVDAVGHSSIIMQCLKATATFGEIILLGSPRVSVTGDLNEAFMDIHLRGLQLKGALEWNRPVYTTLNENSQAQNMERIIGWLQDGRLNIAPLVSHVLPPTEAKRAYEGLLHDKDNYTGVVLKW
jgi:2-desacetyl-2-hydroxyethyl bacteriochlorophyllide A dehydrogenase